MFAIVFEEVLKRQKTTWYMNQEFQIKEKPVCPVGTSQENTNESWRCGADTLTLKHLKHCNRTNIICNNYAKKSLLKICDQTKGDNAKLSGKIHISDKMKRLANRVQRVDHCEEEDYNADQLVLEVEHG